MISVQTETGEETLSLAEFEARVKQGRIGPRTAVRFPILTGERWVDARELELFGRLYEPARIYFRQSFTLRGFPAVTTALVLFQILLYLGMAGFSRSVDLDPLISYGAKVRANILELGETWRLLTANYLHRDVLHLVFNMFFLFNVGGTIENAYRKQDYVLILVVSGLGTTALSTFLGPLPSVGASGMVLGLFGAASVFGYKYGDILPSRYRRYFVGAVLPYTLFVLYVGLATRDTDNWAHLGGLLGGCVAAIPLRPKLLHVTEAKHPSAVRRFLPGISAAVLVVATVAVGPILKAAQPKLSELVDFDSGLRVAYPPGWGFGENHLGYASWGNTLGTTVGLRARIDRDRPVDIDTLRKRFLDDELESRKAKGDLTHVAILGERPIPIAGGDSVVIDIELKTRAGVLKTQNILIARGYYSYFVVLAAPAAFADKYAPIFEAMVREIRLVDPARVVQSRRLAESFPGMSSAHVELGNELASIGAVAAAAEAYKHALETLPDYPEALYGLARLALDYDGDLDSAAGVAERLHNDRPEDPALAALLADIWLRQGQVDAARAVLEETLDYTPNATELRERLVKVR